MHTKSLAERLNDRSMPVPWSGCQIWLGAIQVKGYGFLSVNSYPMLAHRASYSVHKGAIPDGMMVLHRCDVRLCINPDHLFLGTAMDNTKDMVQKGRDSGSKLKACKNGHAFIDGSFYLMPTNTGSRRVCKTCLRARVKKWRTKKRELMVASAN